MNTEIHDTGVECTSCRKGKIVAEIKSVYIPSDIDGPGGYSTTRRSISFFCPTCCILFHHPPGHPDMAAELDTELRNSDWRTEKELRKEGY